jgi:serine/threonine protein kinase
MGLVFYEMLTGEVVFLDGDVMRRQIEEIPTPLGELVPDLPDGIEEIAHRCVAKNAADRFGTAADVVRALKKIQFT